MLPKSYRISRGDIKNSPYRGKKYDGHGLFLEVIRLEDNKHSKFSFSISKKVKSSAVERNKLRRRGYSIISKNLNLIKDGNLCMFSFKKHDKSLTFKDLETEILELLSRAHMII